MVYCFDLDGTLCNTDGNNYSDSTPNKERIELVNKLYESGTPLSSILLEVL
jgi:hydroxymethylpyrimidine pyrophosphatase-like HAD family hydrolase